MGSKAFLKVGEVFGASRSQFIYLYGGVWCRFWGASGDVSSDEHPAMIRQHCCYEPWEWFEHERILFNKVLIEPLRWKGPQGLVARPNASQMETNSGCGPSRPFAGSAPNEKARGAVSERTEQSCSRANDCRPFFGPKHHGVVQQAAWSQWVAAFTQ